VSGIQQKPTNLKKVAKSLPQGSQMAPISAKMSEKTLQNTTQKHDGKKHRKRHLNKTCLSKGTGSAFKGGEFAQRIYRIPKENNRNISRLSKE